MMRLMILPSKLSARTAGSRGAPCTTVTSTVFMFSTILYALLTVMTSIDHGALADISIGDESLGTAVGEESGPVNDFQHLEEAKVAARKLLSLIHHRYELGGSIGSQFFLASNNIGRRTWDMLKTKLAAKITASHLNVGVEDQPSSSRNETFLMIFGGSSVTAGHDSYYNQAYPAIVYQRMAPLFSALGIQLVVHNIAQGANNCAPYVLCYESMGGLDPDFVNWEQSYNCGHDEPIFETMGRVASWSPNNRAVVYYSASGAWAPKDCPESTDAVPYCSEDWTPDVAGLPEWEPTINDIIKEKELLIKYHDAVPSSKRFSSWSRDFPGVGVHGFNVWENNPHCTYNKDGKTLTGCNGIDATQKCDMKFMSKEASYYGSDEGNGANWHPTRAFHMLRGEAIVWIYTLILMESMFLVEEGIESGKTSEAMHAEFAAELKELQTPLGHPKHCSNYVCDKRPTCFTDFKPHYPKNMTLSELIVGSNYWNYDPEEYQEWSLHYGYLDAKPKYSSESAELGEIHLHIWIGDPAEEKPHFVWLCGPGDKTMWSHAEISVDLNVPEDRLNKEYEPPLGASGRKKWSELHEAASGIGCVSVNQLPPGHHVVSIAASTQDSGISITHVIMWH